MVLAAGTTKRDLFVVMLDLDGAACKVRRKDHDQRADHVIGFLRILVGDEELAGSIDQQVVQVRPQARAVGQSQIAPNPIEHWSERSSPRAALDRDAALGNLPAIADPRIETNADP
jgi:hypothetical protein